MKEKIKRMISRLSPSLMTRLMYFHHFHRIPDLKKPETINEKIQYLKLNDYYNNSVVTECVDKWRVRKYLARKGFGHLSPRLILEGIQDPEEIRKHWDELPDAFVIKCNHGSGYNILIRQKSAACVDEVVARLHDWMNEDYWMRYGETQYRFIQKAILVEEYLGDQILTYKFYCFHGVPKVVYALLNAEETDYPDGTKAERRCAADGQEVTVLASEEKYVETLTADAAALEQMMRVSRALSADFPFVRVDLYNIDGKIYFSELTFIPTGGLMRISPPEVMDEWGRMLDLS